MKELINKHQYPKGTKLRQKDVYGQGGDFIIVDHYEYFDLCVGQPLCDGCPSKGEGIVDTHGNYHCSDLYVPYENNNQ